jgi:ribose-phosphate pyrophosphokinase
MGGAKRSNAYARFLGAPLIICHKTREKANQVGQLTAIGEVEGKNVIILDDMVDTAGTITAASNMMMEKGALSVRVFATHPVLSGPAYERLAKSSIKELVVTDTIPLKQNKNTEKIKVLSVAELFADVINKVYNFESISEKFII